MTKEETIRMEKKIEKMKVLLEGIDTSTASGSNGYKALLETIDSLEFQLSKENPVEVTEKKFKLHVDGGSTCESCEG